MRTKQFELLHAPFAVLPVSRMQARDERLRQGGQGREALPEEEGMVVRTEKSVIGHRRTGETQVSVKRTI